MVGRRLKWARRRYRSWTVTLGSANVRAGRSKYGAQNTEDSSNGGQMPKSKSQRRRHLSGDLRSGLQTPGGVNISDSEIAELRQLLQGTIVASTDQGYDASRQLTNHAFSPWPLLIAYCDVPADVAACLAWAQKYDIWTVIRSGGHSTAGYSANTGLVIDMSHFRYVVVEDPSAASPTAIVGAGTDFGHLNSVLNDYDLHVPGGGCPDVCVAGYMQGGGFGFTSRAFGMNCDNVSSMRLMLADGRIVIADPTTNSDLYWAVRGGTGNNFAVLLEVRYQLQHIGPKDIWGFGLQWDASDGATAMVMMQEKFMRNSDSKLGYMSFFAVDCPDATTSTPLLMMRGMYLGTEADAQAALAPLLATPGVRQDVGRYGSYEDLNGYLLSWPREIPEVPDLGREDKSSAYIDRPLLLAEWQAVVERFLETPNPWSTIVFEPYGGRISAISPDDNAFIHRNVDMDIFVDVFWMTDEEHTAAQAYLDGFVELLASMTNGHSYQNYPRRGTDDFRWRYWGGSFNNLLKIKQKYDPANFFHFAQSISTPEVPDPRLDAGPDLSGPISAPIQSVSPGR